ncbi:MAG: aromatic amino acid transport family protein [Simkaniaceae bacterium]|nr:aromatic amino acid transport family protein [Simkaniaceae bacterium]
MHRKIGTVFLVAGTCIGSGIIALPIVLAKLGLIPSIMLMLITWFVMYYTSLVNLELNLQAGKGIPLGALGRVFSGRTAEFIGVASLKLLSYALLAVFIYGGSSIIQEFLVSRTGIHTSFEMIATLFAVGAVLVILLPLKFIDYINRILFFALLIVVAVLLIGLAISIKWSNLPWFADKYNDLPTWIAIIPVVFTSFGFQVIFHTLTNYCHKKAPLLKHAFFWGSLIPAILYIIWTSSILSVLHQKNPIFYQKMVHENTEVGELINALSTIAKSEYLQLLIWSISLIAIVTSIIGVGIGLLDSLRGMLSDAIPTKRMRNTIASIIAITPAYLAVVYVPNAFISILGFAGMILAVIAVLLPVYLFYKLKTKDYHFAELKQKWLIKLSTLAALIVIACEIYNMM